MADSILKKIGSADFNADKYVKELARACVGGEELQKRRDEIRALGDEAADALKRNAYENYAQFVSTAGEISHLEAEMYQLSHLLTEQRNLLDSLAAASMVGVERPPLLAAPREDVEDDREKRRLKLDSIAEKVENCISLHDDRILLHEGDLLELNADDDSPLQRAHAYLFDDRLLIATWISNRRGPVRYKYQSSYSIGDMAVVNVRDLGNVKRAFKLLAFPDARVFQCNSVAGKKDWLDKFEAAKKAYLAKNDKIKQETHKRESVVQEKSLERPESIDSPTNPFETRVVEVPSLPEWLVDVGEELDVLIVERHFEKAFELARKAEEHLKSEELSTVPEVAETLEKVSCKRKTLRDAVLRELEATPERTSRGGLRAIRGRIRLLIKLETSAEACERFLAICSKTIEARVKGAQLEGSTVAYAKQVGEAFFCTMTDVIGEFAAAFPADKTSALVVWASAELRAFAARLAKQIFAPQASLASTAQCVESLRDQCRLLKEYGLDLCFQLDGSLRNCVVRSLRDYRERVADSTEAKLVEDRWTPVNLNTKVGVNEFLAEMRELGLVLAKYVINETWIDLSSSTIWFTRSVLTLQCHGLRMVSEDMMDALDESIYGIFNARLKLSIGNDSSYAQKNFKFILDTLLPVMLRKYSEETGYENEKLVALAQKFGISTPKKVTSNVAKYESDFL